MTQISALPVAANAVGTADVFVLDQIDSGTLTTTQVSAANVRTFMQANLGTVAFEAMPAAGLVRSTGTHLATATLEAGLSLDAGGSLYNTGVLSIGGVPGAILLGTGLSMSGQSLEVSGTGIVQIGTMTGPTITLGPGMTQTGETLEGILAQSGSLGMITMSGSGIPYSATGTGTFTDLVLGQGLQNSTGTLLNVGIVAVGSYGGGFGSNTITLGAGGTINVGGTLSFSGTGVAAITAGTGISITGTDTINNSGILQFGTDTGAIVINAPLHEASNTLSLNVGAGVAVTSNTLVNSGVLAIGTITGDVVLGSGLVQSGSTLSATGAVTSVGTLVGSIGLGSNLTQTGGTLNAASGLLAPSAGAVYSNGTTLGALTLVGLSYNSGTLSTTAAVDAFSRAMGILNAAFGMEGLS